MLASEPCVVFYLFFLRTSKVLNYCTYYLGDCCSEYDERDLNVMLCTNCGKMTPNNIFEMKFKMKPKKISECEKYLSWPDVINLLFQLFSTWYGWIS